MVSCGLLAESSLPQAPPPAAGAAVQWSTQRKAACSLITKYLAGKHQIRENQQQFLLAVRDIMVASLLEVGPTLLSAMAAVERLSKFQPKFSAPLRRSLETWGLRLVLGRPSVPGEEGAQAPGSAAEKGLLAMLAGLLREDPSAGHLASLLEQLVYWAQVDWEAPRHRSIKVILDLLGAMRELPSINFWEGDGLGSLVVQLAVSWPTRKEASGRGQGGPSGREQLLTWVSIYELFWNHLSIGQQSSFESSPACTALLLLGRVSQEAGLILLYSSIGQARPLLGRAG
uniref:Uncharacterized protein n=1 Tax=Sphaerodactylus townsendi TaxID=933632 RepID=A0ACB8F894_9SAUR